ncbi:class I SAM-dependent methyltransferase, partial [Mycolicibacterium elephantis]
PGGAVPCDEDVVDYSRDAGFSLDQLEKLSPHYVRTLRTWADALEARHDEAVAVTSEEVYQRYMRYLTGCADFFERGICEVGQFTLVK